MKVMTIKRDKSNWLLYCFVAFFFLIALYLNVSGFVNIYQIHKSEECGGKIQAEVSSIRVDNSGENLVEYYTFSYEWNGEKYSAEDTSDTDLHIGDTVNIYISPDNPNKIVIPNQNVYMATIMFILALCGSFCFSQLSKFSGWIKKNLFVIMSGYFISRIIVAVLLHAITLIVLDILALLLLVIIRILIIKRRKSN